MPSSMPEIFKFSMQYAWNIQQYTWYVSFICMFYLYTSNAIYMWIPSNLFITFYLYQIYTKSLETLGFNTPWNRKPIGLFVAPAVMLPRPGLVIISVPTKKVAGSSKTWRRRDSAIEAHQLSLLIHAITTAAALPLAWSIARWPFRSP